MSADSPDWGELSSVGSAETFIGQSFTLGLATSGFALAYSGPSRYRAWAGMLEPSVGLFAGRVGVQGHLQHWLGRTSVRDTRGPLGSSGEVTTDLELIEGGLDLWLALGSMSAGIGADLSQVRGRTYTTPRAWASARATDRLALSAGSFLRSGEGDTHGAFVVAASYQVDRTLQLEATLSRTLPDLLLGSEPTASAALTLRLRLGKRAGSLAGAAAREPVLADVLDEAGDSSGLRVVRFRLAIRADSVAVVGDFTGWQPSPMRPIASSAWVTERVVQPGVYRYAFIVDGAWYVPEGARGLVDDGFGEKNLVLVVPEG